MAKTDMLHRQLRLSLDVKLVHCCTVQQMMTSVHKYQMFRSWFVMSLYTTAGEGLKTESFCIHTESSPATLTSQADRLLSRTNEDQNTQEQFPQKDIYICLKTRHHPFTRTRQVHSVSPAYGSIWNHMYPWNEDDSLKETSSPSEKERFNLTLGRSLVEKYIKFVVVRKLFMN